MNGGKVSSSSAPQQNVLRNFRQWICVLGRAPRASVPPPSAKSIAAVIVMLIAVGRLHVPRRHRGQRLGAHLAAVVRGCVRADYRSRPGRLVPVSVRLRSALSRRRDVAAADTPDAGRAGDAHGAVRVSVSGDRPAGAVRHHRQAPDRPRAALCRQSRRPLHLSAVRLGARICQHAVRPRHDGGVGGDRDRRAVAEEPRRDVALRARHHVQPRRRAGAPSERCHRRRGGRCRSARFGCGAPSRRAGCCFPRSICGPFRGLRCSGSRRRCTKFCAKSLEFRRVEPGRDGL